MSSTGTLWPVQELWGFYCTGTIWPVLELWGFYCTGPLWSCSRRTLGLLQYRNPVASTGTLGLLQEPCGQYRNFGAYTGTLWPVQELWAFYKNPLVISTGNPAANSEQHDFPVQYRNQYSGHPILDELIFICCKISRSLLPILNQRIYILFKGHKERFVLTVCKI